MGEIRWEGQKHAEGCGPACLAMLSGMTYEDVLAEIATYVGTGHSGNWDTSGVTHYTLDEFVNRRGYFIQRRYASDEHWIGGWPPKPFAERHYLSVKQPSGNSHFVVMDSAGRVFDPLQEGVFTLDHWPAVENIVGLLRA